jgi:hypothetical protein
VDRCREASVGSRSRGKTAWRRNKHRAPYTNIAEQATEFERLARPTARLDPQVGRKIKSLKNEGHEEHEGKAQRYSLRVARTAPRGSPRRPGDCGGPAPCSVRTEEAGSWRSPGRRRADLRRLRGPSGAFCLDATQVPAAPRASSLRTRKPASTIRRAAPRKRVTGGGEHPTAQGKVSPSRSMHATERAPAMRRCRSGVIKCGLSARGGR